MDTINIMVLEDNEDDRFFIKKSIDEMGRTNYSLYETDGEFYAALKKDIHVCIIDHFIGSKTGLEVLRDVKNRNRGTFVIVYTGVRDEDIIIEYLNSGADRFVGKWKKNHLSLLQEYLDTGLRIAKGHVGFINYLMSQKFKINDD